MCKCSWLVFIIVITQIVYVGFVDVDVVLVLVFVLLLDVFAVFVDMVSINGGF